MNGMEGLLAAFGVKAPGVWAPPLLAACGEHEINTPLRTAAFLANVLHETGRLSVLSESLNYTPAALLRQWGNHFTSELAGRLGRLEKLVGGRRVVQRAADERQIAEYAYGGRYGNGAVGSGDGWLFRGNGGMMTTFRGNYMGFAKTIAWTQPLEDLPAYLRTPLGASQSAGMFFKTSGCLALADRGDIVRVREVLNGGRIGLPDVQALYPRLLAALHGSVAPPAPEPPTSDDLNQRELDRQRSLL